MADINQSNWSETDSANNSSATAPGFPENMNPSQVDDNMRALMGSIKRWYDRINGTVTAGGSANAITLTYAVAPGSLVKGDRFCFIVGTTNTAAATANINALGATQIVRGGVALVGGEMIAGTVAELVYDGSAYQLVGGARFRTLLPGDTNYYVNASTGNDSTGNGSVGLPWATLQHGYSWLVGNVDGGGYNVIINQSGTDTGGLSAIVAIPGAAFTSIILNGNVTVSGSTAISVIRSGTKIKISGSGTITSGKYGIAASEAAFVDVSGVSFGASTNVHLYAQLDAQIFLSGNYSISGGSGAHWNTDSDADISAAPGITITLSGTPAFSAAFALSTTNGSIQASGLTFSGAATGTRYTVNIGGVIYVGGGGASYLPGNAPGSADATSFGYYG